jgi:GTP diphosphokinase / guanosine-3',5'-bis(diphosphate) 3'-diphosphatase
MKHQEPAATSSRRSKNTPAAVGRALSAEQDPSAAVETEAAFTAPLDERQVVSLAGLTQAASAYLSDEDVRRVRDAYRVSDSAHLGQFRSSGEPYISHPIAVAEICVGWRLDADALMAALLHDVMEDSGTTKQQLVERFGAQVAELVDGLSKLDKVEFASREQAQAESFRKMLLAMARDVRVILIKLADRLHNMRTLDAVDRGKQRRVAIETLDIYAPIANRLGLNELYRELLDLSFRFQHPVRHRTLHKAVAVARGTRREGMNRIVEAVNKKLPEMGITAQIETREKALWAIYRKMRDKRLSFSQVMDVFGMRLVVDTLPECYLALGALHQTFRPIPGRFKDYIAIPKINGYQSLHSTVVGPFGTPVEFQIRTREMHQLAESGVAAHWLYKAEKESFSELQVRTHQWLKSLLDIQNQTGDSLEFIEHVKVDLFPDAVYVFTPRGQIRALPRGATVIDFAYSVHTDVGNQCVAAKVNANLVPLRTELQNGDVVEVITDPGSRANPAWLGFVRTGKARSEIRHFLRTMNYEESAELGKRLLEQSLASLRIDMRALAQPLFEKVARDAGAKSVDELHADVGLGRRLAPVVARAISLEMNARQPTMSFAPRPLPIVIHGTEGMAVQCSNCCHPLPGDAIIGHMRGGHGLMIHRTECDTARRQQAKDAERWIDVEWADEVRGSFRTILEVQIRDERGALGRIAADIAASEANIVSVGMDDEPDHIATIRFTLMVRERLHLAQVFRRLRKQSDVIRITRL